MVSRRVEGTGRRILIIEDNLDAAESMQLMLQMFGHVAMVSLTGRAGLETARSFLPDVIFCDLGLPQMDVLAVAQAIRADPGLRDTRLVALTGYGRVEDVEDALRSGFDCHVTKPAEPGLLLRMICP